MRIERPYQISEFVPLQQWIECPNSRKGYDGEPYIKGFDDNAWEGIFARGQCKQVGTGIKHACVRAEARKNETTPELGRHLGQLHRSLPR